MDNLWSVEAEAVKEGLEMMKNKGCIINFYARATAQSMSFNPIAGSQDRERIITLPIIEPEADFLCLFERNNKGESICPTPERFLKHVLQRYSKLKKSYKRNFCYKTRTYHQTKGLKQNLNAKSKGAGPFNDRASVKI